MQTKPTAALILLLAFLICGCTSPSSSDGTSPPPAADPDAPPAIPGDKPSHVEADPTFRGSKAGQEWSGNDLEIKFCWCPAGKFMMGSPEDEAERFDHEQ